MKVSIIVSVTNNDAFFKCAVHSFNNLKNICNNCTIIPVFNHLKKIHLISAINQALSACDSDIIAIIHQDALLSVDCWSKIIAAFTNDSVGVVGFAGISYTCSYSDCFESGLPVDSSFLVGTVYSHDRSIIWNGRSDGEIHSPDEFAFCVRNIGRPVMSVRTHQHHYAADISMIYRSAGYRVIGVCSDPVHDISYSSSTGDGGFIQSLIELRERWHLDFDEHLMPHSCWSGNIAISRMPVTIGTTSSNITSQYQLFELA